MITNRAINTTFKSFGYGVVVDEGGADTALISTEGCGCKKNTLGSLESFKDCCPSRSRRVMRFIQKYKVKEIRWRITNAILCRAGSLRRGRDNVIIR